MNSKQIKLNNLTEKKKYMEHSCAYIFIAISLLIAYVLFAIFQDVYLIPILALITGLLTTLFLDLCASFITESRSKNVIVVISVGVIACIIMLLISYSKVTEGIPPELNLYVAFGPVLGGYLWSAFLHIYKKLNIE